MRKSLPGEKEKIKEEKEKKKSHSTNSTNSTTNSTNLTFSSNTTEELIQTRGTIYGKKT